MMPARSRDGDDREGGFTLVLVALVISILLLLVSLILDAGRARRDRVADAAVTDSAATAGAAAMVHTPGPPDTYDSSGGCAAAIDHLQHRMAGSPTFPAGYCLPFSTACTDGDTADARMATTTAGDLTITITNPVPDDHLLMAGQPPNATVDRVPCARLGIRVERARTATVVTRDLDLVVRAVAVADITTTPQSADLIR